MGGHLETIKQEAGLDPRQHANLWWAAVCLIHSSIKDQFSVSNQRNVHVCGLEEDAHSLYHVWNIVSSPLFWQMVHFVSCQKTPDTEERMLFPCFQTNISLTLMMSIILHHLWLFIFIFTFIRAPHDCWLWEWCSLLLRCSLNTLDVWSVVLLLRRGRCDHPFSMSSMVFLAFWWGWVHQCLCLPSVGFILIYLIHLSHQTCCKS